MGDEGSVEAAASPETQLKVVRKLKAQMDRLLTSVEVGLNIASSSSSDHIFPL